MPNVVHLTKIKLILTLCLIASVTVSGVMYLWPKTVPSTQQPAANMDRTSQISRHQANIQLESDHKLSLSYKNTSVRTILQALADYTHHNMIVSEHVTGQMSVRLEHLSWSEILDAIVKLQGLHQRQVGSVILIDKLANADIDVPKKRKVAPREVVLLQLHYAKAKDLANLLLDKSSSLLSQHGLAGADVRTNLLWVQDKPNFLAPIRQWIQQLDRPHQQVVIEARIVTMNKECATELGVRFGVNQGTWLSGSLAGVNQLQQGVGSNQVPLAQRLNLDLSATPLDANPASLGMALAHLGHNAALDLELSALESRGRAEIVASPSLMTTNQQAATIESGEDIPYQETSLNGGTSIAFKKAVLSLKVTPQIIAPGKLHLDLLINQDSDSGRRVQGVPVIVTKSIATHVLVNQGETIVLGGIYKKDESTHRAAVPTLGEIPVLGQLFRHTSLHRYNEELLIFITPWVLE